MKIQISEYDNLMLNHLKNICPDSVNIERGQRKGILLSFNNKNYYILDIISGYNIFLNIEIFENEINAELKKYDDASFKTFTVSYLGIYSFDSMINWIEAVIKI